MLFVLGAAVLGLWIYIAYLGAGLNRDSEARVRGDVAPMERTSAAATGELASR
jgi:hypothetical protein